VKILADGQPALVLQHPEDNRTITITPQRSFARKSRPFRSTSLPQRPDITVELTTSSGERTLLAFDPKYKLRSEFLSVFAGDDSLEGQPGQPKKVDIDKMHAYRDAIRDEDGNPGISYAAILYPGATVTYDDGGVGALTALPGSSESLLANLRRLIGTWAN